MLAACGSAHPTMASGPATSVAAAALPVSGSSASCAGLTRAQQFKTARVVFVGVMLPGHLVGVADDTQLSSPAQVRVSHYLKGRGPSTVRVLTAVKRSGKGYRFAEDGIQPRPGQHWEIYTSSTHRPYSTSICGGSRIVSAKGKRIGG